MKLLDVTLRDGGFTNDFKLDFVNAQKVISILDRAGLDFIEIGYLTGLPLNHGNFEHAGVCLAWPTELISELASQTSSKLVGMLHLEGSTAFDFQQIADSGLNLIRLPVLPFADDCWRSTCEKFATLGLDVSINLTCASWLSYNEITAFAVAAQDCGASMFFIADTNGSLLPAQVGSIFRNLVEVISIDLGFHAHDFKRLALANVISATEAGAKIIDCSVGGLGRSLGNACTEVLQEVTSAGIHSRMLLLRELPNILRMFGRHPELEAWPRVTAFLDFIPPQIESIEQFSKRVGADKFNIAASLLVHPEKLPTNSNKFTRLLTQLYLAELMQ
jgi:4-hydroxy 2-oxovalerate aldolase